MIKNFTHTVCYLFAFFFLSSSSLFAQTAYNFAASSGTFTPLTGATGIPVIQDDDELTSVLPVGFSFNYFGTDYTDFIVSSNGLITFNTSLTDDLHSNSISFSSYNKIIAPLWDDLNGDAGTASYKLTGNSGSQILTVEWLNWKWDYEADNAGISFQLKLYEGSNKIEFIYRPESGDLNGPDASIGLIGNTSSTFYSLLNAGTSPTFDENGFNSINLKPANGQTYTFTPFNAPTIAAGSITASPLASASATFHWTNGNGGYRAVFVKQTSSTSDFFTPADGTKYIASSAFGDFSAYAGSSWYCVYSGTGNSVAVTGLKSTLSYRVQVVEYNGVIVGSQLYNSVQVANNFVTPFGPPGEPLTELLPQYIGTAKITFDFNAGNGDKRAIFIKAGTTGTAPAVNNATYSASTTFGSGTQIGTSGWFCIFNGTTSFGDGVTVSGLTPNTTYSIHAVDYNGSAGNEKYFEAASSDNPVQLTTLALSPTPTYNFAASTGTFTPLTGGTDVDKIEYDDEFSNVISIGFPFRLGGRLYTQLMASSNGFLTFNPFAGNNSGSYNRTNYLTGSRVSPLVAPFWDDLTGINGEASYATSGTAPNRVFTFEFLNWASYGGSASLSFQIKLYETSNKIEYIYRSEAGALASPSASIGLALPDASGSYAFLSLNNTTGSPVVSSVTETANITTKPSSNQVYSFTPVKLSQTITLDATLTKYFGDAAFNLSLNASSSLPVSYASSVPSVATISGNTVTIVGIGTTTITANQAGDDNYLAASQASMTLTVDKGTQIITFNAIPNQEYRSTTFTLTASTPSGLPIAYSSSNTAVATIAGNQLTFTGIGTTTITASQAGNANYNAATPVGQPLTVVKGSQTITFNPLPAKNTNDAAFTLNATASSGFAVSYTSSNSAVATVSGNTVTIVGAGTTNITASQPGDTKYNAASSVVRSLEVLNAKSNQTITFNSLDSKKFGDAAFDLTGTSTSGLDLTYTSSDATVATVSGKTVTIVGAGTTTITASQSGDATHNAASSVGQQLTVNKADQTITFDAIPTKVASDAPFTLSATSTSSLPVKFVINPFIENFIALSGVNNNTVTILKAGLILIKAQQSGNANYNEAFAEQTFCINPVKPTIEFSGENTLLSSSPQENHWFKDGVDMNLGLPGITISAAGTYTLVVSSGTCSSVPSDPIVVVVTALEDVASLITVSPNPSQKEIRIDLTSLGKEVSANIEIHDLLGRTLHSSKGSGIVLIDITTFEKGNYILGIKSGNKTVTKQIAKN